MFLQTAQDGLQVQAVLGKNHLAFPLWLCCGVAGLEALMAAASRLRACIFGVKTSVTSLHPSWIWLWLKTSRETREGARLGVVETAFPLLCSRRPSGRAQNHRRDGLLRSKNASGPARRCLSSSSARTNPWVGNTAGSGSQHHVLGLDAKRGPIYGPHHTRQILPIQAAQTLAPLSHLAINQRISTSAVDGRLLN